MKKVTRFFLILLFLSVLINPAVAQEPAVELDNVIVIGDTAIDLNVLFGDTIGEASRIINELIQEHELGMNQIWWRTSTGTFSCLADQRRKSMEQRILFPVSTYIDENLNYINLLTTGAKSDNKELRVHFIDVGQGDAIFIDYGEYDILIDTGGKAAGPLVTDYLIEQKTDRLEILVATHPHADHIGGMDTVIYDWRIDTLIDSGLEYDTKTYERYRLHADLKYGLKFIEDKDMTFEIDDGITFEIIETGDNYSNVNNNSVICKLSYNDIDFLFTGDMESDVESKILHRDIEAEVLKLGHHGSSTSTSTAFLEKVKPQFAVVSASVDNSYGHPHDETLQRLDEHGVTVLGTHLLGDVVITTDGEDLELTSIEEQLAELEKEKTAEEEKQRQEEEAARKLAEQRSLLPQTVLIEDLDKDDELVTILNNTEETVDLTGWYMISVKGNQRYDFENGFTLEPAETFKLASGMHNIMQGLYPIWEADDDAPTTYIWNNEHPDPCQLYNDKDELISEFED